LTAGLSKTQSWEWWTGWGLPRILSTRYFGHPLSARLMWQHRWIALGSSWVVIIWESLFVLCLALPPRAALVVVAVGLGLHLACAITMSLSMFVWAYAACYPSVLLVNAWIVGETTTSQRLSLILGGALAIIGTGAFFAGRVSAEPIGTRTGKAAGPPAGRTAGRPSAATAMPTAEDRPKVAAPAGGAG
jgi:hypothetical protein